MWVPFCDIVNCTELYVVELSVYERKLKGTGEIDFGIYEKLSLHLVDGSEENHEIIHIIVTRVRI